MISNLSWPNIKNFLMDLLVSTHTRRFTSIFFQAWSQYTTNPTLFLVLMNKPSKRIFNRWLMLVSSKNEVFQNGPQLASSFLRKMVMSDKSLTYDHLINVLNKKYQLHFSNCTPKNISLCAAF